jgi:hypothetical protein
MSDWGKMAKAFDFIEAVTAYLNDIVKYGDYQAWALHEQVLSILDKEQDQ